MTSTEPGSLFWLHALTPLRIGGDTGLGAINLPTLREQHTGHPVVPGSSIKGVLRGALTPLPTPAPQDPDPLTEPAAEAAPVPTPTPSLLRSLFGPDREHASDHRGALVFTDATLVALPVRSLWGTFGWCTSRLCLRRLSRDRQAIGLSALPTIPDTKNAQVTTQSALRNEGQIFIEEQAVAADPNTTLDEIAATLAAEIWPTDNEDQRFFIERLVVLPDDALNALALISLEVRARVSLDPQTGTAAASGPWLEESMPAETLLSGLTLGRDTKVFAEGADPTKEGVVLKANTALQQLRDAGAPAGALAGALTFGGHTSVGYGRAMFRLVPRVIVGGE